MITIDKFIENWRGKNSMSPINSKDVTETEATLNVQFPHAYKYLLTTYGLVRSANVMNSVIDLDTKLGQAHDFLSLEDVSALSNLYEMSGMAKGYILFASDAGGNMFCFNKLECETEKDDCAVWLFDSSTFLITKQTDSFVEWLQGFNTRL